MPIEWAAFLGQEMRALGMNFDYAPAVEEALFRTPSNISVRTYSDNPFMVAEFCKQFVRGLQEQGVVATLKHFPGYTGVMEDAHLAIPTVRRTHNELEKVELNAFQQVIDGGADAVMAGHMLWSCSGARASPLHLLPAGLYRFAKRAEWGFRESYFRLHGMLPYVIFMVLDAVQWKSSRQVCICWIFLTN